MHTIKRLLQFDSGHRVLRHESKCAHLHGHRYTAEVVVRGRELDNVSRVIDFGLVKQLVGGWIDENWDHNILLNSQDPLLKALATCDGRARDPKKVGQLGALEFATTSPVSYEVFAAKRPYILQNKNPTAEVMAEELFYKAKELLENPTAGLLVWRVRVWETPNCCADFTIQDHHEKRDNEKQALAR